MQELRLLVAAAQESTAQRIQQELSSLSFRVFWAASADEASNILLAEKVDGMMVFLPLPGDGIKLVLRAAETEIFSLFLIARAEMLDQEEKEKLRRAGIVFLPKPLSREQLSLSLESTICARARFEILQDRQDQLQRKIRELRSVERAKALLMKTLGMTENQAHRFIEKQAMDDRQTKADVAMRILKTYVNI